MTLRRYVEIRLGDELTLWINPTTIDFDVGTKWPVSRQMESKINGLLPVPLTRGLIRPLLHQLEPFVIPSWCYGLPKPVGTIEKYRRVEDFIQNRRDLKSTIWYRDLVHELEHRGVATHKTLRMYGTDDIYNFFKTYVCELIESMSRTGYCLRKGADLGAVIINRHGTLEKAGSGNHRFYVAKVLGLQRFPVRVTGVHSDWWCAQKEIRANFGVCNLPGALAVVEQKHQ